MKGFPQNISTVQDFKNLLNMPEFKQKALDELQAIIDLNDDKALKATTLIDPDNEEKGYNTVAIDNPMPLWKQKGFANKKAVADLINKFK